MTFAVGALFSAVESNNYRMLWTMMHAMTMDELVKAGTAVGPQRLRELLFRFVGKSRKPSQLASSAPAVSSATANLEAVIPELLAEAFADKTFLPASHGQAITREIRQLLRTVHNQRAASPQIVLYRDVTHTLPSPNSCPAPLTEENFADVASRNGICVAAIKAVAQVESGGRSGFDDQYRAKILFEAHHFRKHTAKRFDLSHPHLSCRRASAKKYYSWNQYSRLFEAMVLDPVAAIKACSWGKFQVLGSNHNGWPDPVSFARAMQESENNHLKSFEAYCVKNGLIVHLKNKAWAKFAEGYNGKNYKDFDYDTKIAKAYAKYGGT